MPAEEETDGVVADQVEIDANEDVQQIKTAPSPKLPSPQEVEDHRNIHIPFRDWCRFCVMGRGRGLQHSRALASWIAIVALDYFFITRGGVTKRGDLEPEYPRSPDGEKDLNEDRRSGKIVKCLIIRCLQTKVVFAHVVPYKGASEDNFVAQLVVSDIEWLGHTRMIVKADNEPAIRTLVVQALERARVKCEGVESISQEHPARYDSQSNGGIEVGVQLIRGLFRTLKLCAEARIGKFIPVSHAIVSWLLEHTALLLNVRQKGADGLTSWERVRGRPFNQRLLSIFERVLYKLPMKGPQSRPDGNMGTKWADAVFLGYHRSSNSYIVCNSEGVTTTRSLARRPESERWCADSCARIQATPWSLYEKPEPEVRFNEPATEGGAVSSDDHVPALRRMRINKADLDRFGYTVGCPQCRHTEEHGLAKPGATHTPTCRARIVAEIAKDPAGQRRIAEYDERLNRNIADRIPRDVGDGEPRIRADHREEPERTTDQQRNELGVPETRPSHRETLEREPRRQAADHDRGADPVSIPVPTAHSGPSPAAGGSHSRMPDEHAAIDVDQEGPTEDPDDGMSIGFLGSMQPCDADRVSLRLLQMLGSSTTSKRPVRSARTISEIYSPPRVTAELRRCRNQQVLPGFALDLTVLDPDDGQAWDFSRKSKRDKALRMVLREKPYLLIGSPMCTAFSTWQALNQSRTDPERMRRAYDRAVQHMEFVTMLYQEQLHAGRYFLHEHPESASSWVLKCIRTLLQTPGVQRVVGDQCQYGALVNSGVSAGQPVKKPTGFMTNSPEIAQELKLRCQGGPTPGACSRPGGGHHTHCSGKIAREAAIYPRGLCRAIIKGTANQLRADGITKNGCFGLQAKDDEEEITRACYGPAQGYSGKYHDDVTGQILRDELVDQARALELDFFNKKGVWRKRHFSISRQITGKPPISVRWVDVNKGDEANPNYRSRLVARQLKAHDHSGASYFAPAPPLEALRTVLSLAVTSIGDHRPILDPLSPHRSQVSFIDIKRAYFNAVISEHDPPTFVKLPEEDKDHGTMCAQLLRHMYGTRLAADGWQEEYSTFLISLGYCQGLGHPNLFLHSQRGLRCSVHGDDFTTSGPCNQLDWFEEEMKKHYDLTTGPRLGPGPKDAKEGRALNRVIRWTPAGLEYEADPRQAEKLIAECGMENSQPVATPGVRPTAQEILADKVLDSRLSTPFRGAAARGNYLAADRADSQFAHKEICRSMATPTAQSWVALKRTCRFLKGRPRLVYLYPVQCVDKLDVYTDTDWAGCPRTRKSTSGGSIMLGRHVVKHWSSTQSSTALSSGEAEFNGVVRGSGQGLGYQSLLADLGIQLPLRVWTDSSAALGICNRQGLGKLRHLDTHTLWVQQAVRLGRVDLRKIAGEQNPADLFTKHSISRDRLTMLVELHGCCYRDGRAESAPAMRSADSSRATMASAGRAIGAIDVRSEPYMPHLMLSPAELDRLHPSVPVPEEEELDDDASRERLDKDDRTLQRGMQIAATISADMKERGRLRH